MRLFLGVDGGQSATKAVIGDETGRVLGAGDGGPCNHTTGAEGRAKLERVVGGCVSAACGQAGIDSKNLEFEAACFGMSGGPEDKESILAEILNAKRLIVTNDAVIALSGATTSGQGIITISGTGSIAFGRNAEGRTKRVGGWGYIYGDEGSGFDIARRALRAILRMEEGWGPSTRLHELLLDATGMPSALDVLHLFYTPDWPRSRVATLAKLVDTVAMEGDAVAVSILQAEAQELATMAASVRSQLWKEGEPVQIAYIGGAFRSRLLLERFLYLVELEPGTECGPPRRDPARGALMEAYRAAGVELRIDAE